MKRVLLGVLAAGTAFAFDLKGSLDVSFASLKNYGGEAVHYTLKGKAPMFTVRGQIREERWIGEVSGSYFHFAGEKFDVGTAADRETDLTHLNIELKGGYSFGRINPYIAAGWDKYKIELNQVHKFYRDRALYWRLGVYSDKDVYKDVKGIVDVSYGRIIKGQNESEGFQTSLKKKDRIYAETGIKWKEKIKFSVFYEKKKFDYKTGLKNRYRMIGIKTGFMF